MVESQNHYTSKRSQAGKECILNDSIYRKCWHCDKGLSSFIYKEHLNIVQLQQILFENLPCAKLYTTYWDVTGNKIDKDPSALQNFQASEV